MIYTYIVYYYIMFILFSARNTISYVSPRRRLIINKGMFYKYSGFRLTFRGLSHWSTNGTCHFEILHLSSTLININRYVRYDESSAIFLQRDPSLWFFILEFRSESMTRSIDAFRSSSRNFEKRNPFDYSARSLSYRFSLLSNRFRSLRCDQIKQRIVLCPFFMYDTKALHRHACVLAHTHTHTYVRTHTHTIHRDCSSYIFMISKNTLIWKKYIYISYVYAYTYMYICIFLAYVPYILHNTYRLA